MKQDLNTLQKIEGTTFVEQKYNKEFSQLKETIIPSSYITAILKEKKALKISFDSKINLERLIKKYPSIIDFLTFNVKHSVDPFIINKSLDFLLEGKLYCVENKFGNLKFLKFVKNKSFEEPLKTDSTINFLNLDKIPIYTIKLSEYGKENDFSNLTLKIPRQKEYVIGFLNFKDAFIYLNGIQRNGPFISKQLARYHDKKFLNLKKNYITKIETSNLEVFYKKWRNTNFNTFIIPGENKEKDFQSTIYYTKTPFYQFQNKKIFLSSFSKNSLKNLLKETKVKNKTILNIDVNNFFDLNNKNFKNQNNFYYFIPYKNQYQYEKTNISSKEIKDLTKINDINKNDDFKNLKVGLITIPGNFFPSLPNYLRIILYPVIPNGIKNKKQLNQFWSLKNLLKSPKEPKKPRRPAKYLRRIYFVREARINSSFRNSNRYKRIYDYDKHLLNYRKLRCSDKYLNSNINQKKKWLRGVEEIKPFKSFPKAIRIRSKRTARIRFIKKLRRRSLYRILRYLRNMEIITNKQKIFHGSFKSFLKSKKIRKRRTLYRKGRRFRYPRRKHRKLQKIWKLRQFFFKQKIYKYKKFVSDVDCLKKLNYELKNSNQSIISTQLSVNEFLKKLESFELIGLEENTGKIKN